MSLTNALRAEVPTTSELRSQVEKTTSTTVEEAQEDPRDQEEWTFEFEWTDARKRTWKGSFTNHILTMGEQQQVASFKSRCLGGVPWESIEPQIRLLNTAVAHMEFSLASDRPSWAKDLRAIRDPSLVYALWDKVTSHEARFFRLLSSEEES